MKLLPNRAVMSMVFVVLLATVSCQMKSVNQTQLKLERYAVTIQDLPKGWIYSGDDWSNQFGGKSYLRYFGTPNNNMIGFGHYISIYADEQKAKIAYPKWEDEWFNATVKWPGADFVPSNPKDEYRFECKQMIPNPSILACSYLQRHNEFIIYVLTDLDGKAMTLAQLNMLLEILDKRLNDVSMGN